MNATKPSLRPSALFSAAALITLLALTTTATAECQIRGTGDLGTIIERATGSVLIVDRTRKERLARIEGLGDLSHASAVYSPDGRYAYLFARDGGLSKIDLLCGRIEKRIIQGGNSIGGAISQDGKLIAVSNYEPGGVKIFAASDLTLVADIPSTAIAEGKNAKTVGLVDAPNQQFVVSLYDSGEIWIIDMLNPQQPKITQLKNIGKLPYDALITPDGRYYISGLFGQDGLAMVDLWHPEAGSQTILAGYGKGEAQLPVYKMPHLEGWAIANDHAFLPAIGHHQVLVAATGSWQQRAAIEVHGQPVFVMARPDGRQIWVNFALPDNDTVQVIDSETRQVIKTLKTGKGTLHMEFSPRGEEIWISVRDSDAVQIYDTRTFALKATIAAKSPSGIFFTSRAQQIGL
ncbi:MAG: protein nirF [Gammaproteobacteria bacterium]|nr:protein nirF [Gammaproteobacteria bacterium]